MPELTYHYPEVQRALSLFPDADAISVPLSELRTLMEIIRRQNEKIAELGAEIAQLKGTTTALDL